MGGFPAVVGDATAPVLPGFVPLSPGIPAGVPLLHPLLKTSIGQPGEWPAFIKPIPDRIALEDRTYLVQKQVLTLPHLQLQNALLKAYVEYVHPYMPLMELHDFLRVVNDRTGAAGKVSLFLYHAVMFAATAFVDEALLKEAGYQSRRDARRAFFSRTRVSCALPDPRHLAWIHVIVYVAADRVGRRPSLSLSCNSSSTTLITRRTA